MTTLLNFAKEIDELISSDLDQPQFHMPARLYGRTNAGIELLGESDGPYELLDYVDKPDSIEVCALVVTGWAAPTGGDDNTPPSKREDRSRCRVILSKNGEGTFTVVRFSNEPEKLNEMGDGGEGLMPLALMAWWDS